MTGSVDGLDQHGLVAGFRPEVMIGLGSPDGIIFAVSGTFFRDFSNDYTYINDSTAPDAGTSWVGLGSTA